MNILDEVLYLTKRYRDAFNQAPTTLLINNDNYQRLCDELNKDEVTNIYGMVIQITSTVSLSIEY